MTRRGRIGSALALVILMVAGGYYYFVQVALPHFHTVREGVLYRAGQPRGIALEWLRARGIRTLINLRTPESDGTPEERRFAQENGLRFYNFPVGTSSAEIRRSVESFLAILDDESNWPVLVHCSRGKERSGVMSAIFRVEYDGWSNERALEEAVRLGLERGALPVPEEFIRNFRRRASFGEPARLPSEDPSLRRVPWQE